MSVLNDTRITAVPGGYDVTCCPGLDEAPTGRVVRWITVDGDEWEAFYLTGDPERTMFPSAEAAVAHLLGEGE